MRVDIKEERPCYLRRLPTCPKSVSVAAWTTAWNVLSSTIQPWLSTVSLADPSVMLVCQVFHPCLLHGSMLLGEQMRYGDTGVEGVMSKCSEETLGVLRANKESLLTILEVFIHDPLYKWQLTSARAQQRQKADTLAEDDAGALAYHPLATVVGCVNAASSHPEWPDPM